MPCSDRTDHVGEKPFARAASAASTLEAMVNSPQSPSSPPSLTTLKQSMPPTVLRSIAVVLAESGQVYSNGFVGLAILHERNEAG